MEITEGDAPRNSTGVRLGMGESRCKVCVQLEEAAAAAQKPDQSSLLAGLNEAGLRNRALQKAELIVKTQTSLEKHRDTCAEWANRPAF
jgi:hypothetical protein